MVLENIFLNVQPNTSLSLSLFPIFNENENIRHSNQTGQYKVQLLQSTVLKIFFYFLFCKLSHA